MTSVQTSDPPESVPCCWSVACPVNAIRSPVAYVIEDDGLSMTGTGGVFPTLMEIGELVPVAPWLSVTVRLAAYVPGVVYGWETWAPLPFVVPSPKSQEYEIGSWSGSLDPVPSKVTESGAAPLVGFAVATAIGGWFDAKYWIRWIVPVSNDTYHRSPDAGSASRSTGWEFGSTTNGWIAVGSGSPLVPRSIAQMQFREWSPKKSAPSYIEG